MKLLRYTTLVGTLFFISAVDGLSATITFVTAQQFTTSVTGAQTINFEGVVATNTAQNFQNPAGLTVAGVNFHTSGSGPFGPGFVTVYGAGLAAMQSAVLNTGTGAILEWAPPNQPGTANLDAVLPGGFQGVAADLWTQQPFVSFIDVTVTAADATTSTVRINTVARPTASFFGVISDAALSSVSFRTPAGQTGLVLDNLRLGTVSPTQGPGPSPVPEPASAILLGIGLIALRVSKSRISASR